MKLFSFNVSPPLVIELAKRYGMAMLAVAIATQVRWWASDAIGTGFPYGTYYVAILASASLFGLGPGLFTMFSGMVLGYWLFVPGQTSQGQIELMRLAVYLASGTIICWFAGRFRSQQLRGQERERQRQYLLNSMGEGFALLEVVHDNQGKAADYRILEVNAAYERFTGLKRDQVLGRSLVEVAAYMEPAWSERYTQLITSGQSLSFEEYSPALGRWFLINARSLGSDRVVVTFVDITEQKKLASEMARLDRLNLIGEMAAAIGHEVRNPLTTVRGYLQLFQRKNELTTFARQIDTMIEEIDRANAIITEFLSLAKNKSLHLEQSQLNDLIHALFPLLQAEAFRLGHNIQLELGDIPEFKFDDHELRQMILNLTRNGLEAMSIGGILAFNTYYNGDTVTLSVRDNGPGIPAEVLKRLGTPFLTTKENGVGLGLPVCYQIAARHGAKIDVTTTPKGTTFFVNFQIKPN
ncbi:MAG: ATP-binding protein [Negativicutes bacterium]|nr:ATP-binding protein [Negativicutes bacterium]